MLKRFGVVFEYSMAWLLPIAGLSFVIAWLKFRKLSKLPDISKGMALLISGLRFIVIFTLLALLLNPAFSWVEKTKEKPLLVLAQDNSASLIKTKDSLYYRNEYKASLEKMSKALKSKFDIVPLTFGASIRQNDEYDYLSSIRLYRPAFYRPPPGGYDFILRRDLQYRCESEIQNT